MPLFSRNAGRDNTSSKRPRQKAANIIIRLPCV